MKKRIDWIDSLKGLAMLFVIWGHSFDNTKGLVRKYIYSFHMPLFFFTSGLTYKDSDISFKEYFIKLIKKLLIPYIFLNIGGLIVRYILYIFDMIKLLPIDDIIFGTLIGNNNISNFPVSHTWFLLTLFLTELLFFVLKRVTKNDKKLFLSTFGISVLGFVSSLKNFNIFLPWHFNVTLSSMLPYFLGYIFMKNIKLFDKFFKDNKKMILSFIILLIISVLTCYFNGKVNMDSNKYGDNFILYYLSFISSIGYLIIFSKLFLSKITILKNVGKWTLVYLGYQKFVILVLKYFIDTFSPYNVYVLTITLLSFIILYPVSYIIYKYIPFLIGKFNRSNSFSG